MKTHKFSIGNTILLNDGRMGKIESLQHSYSDGKEIPSYWVVFGKDVFPDGFARNTWESSIIKKVGSNGAIWFVIVLSLALITAAFYFGTTNYIKKQNQVHSLK